jgi:hypothetical protein
MAMLADLLTRWQSRRAEWARLGVAVDGEKIASEVLKDLTGLAAAADEEFLTLTEAAMASGYNAESLSRLIRQGRLANHGTPRRPRVRRADLPHKPRSALAQSSRRVASSRPAGGPSGAQRDASSIVRDAVAGRIRGIAP